VIFVSQSQDIVYGLDGSQVAGTIIGEGYNGVIILVEGAERFIPREQVLRVERGGLPTEVKAYKAEVQAGMLTITGEASAEEAAAAHPTGMAAATPKPSTAPRPPRASPKPRARPPRSPLDRGTPKPPASPKPPRRPGGRLPAVGGGSLDQLLNQAMQDPEGQRIINQYGGLEAVKQMLAADPELGRMVEQQIRAQLRQRQQQPK
jgi:hypothetical protein